MFQVAAKINKQVRKKTHQKIIMKNVKSKSNKCQRKSDKSFLVYYHLQEENLMVKLN